MSTLTCLKPVKPVKAKQKKNPSAPTKKTTLCNAPSKPTNAQKQPAPTSESDDSSDDSSGTSEGLSKKQKPGKKNKQLKVHGDDWSNTGPKQIENDKSEEEDDGSSVEVNDLFMTTHISTLRLDRTMLISSRLQLRYF